MLNIIEEQKSTHSKNTISDIFLNPNGTYAYLIPANRRSHREQDSSALQSVQSDQGVLLPVFGSDDEAFFIVNDDVPEFVDTLLRIYVQHSKIFILITTLCYAYECMVDFVTYQSRERIIAELQGPVFRMTERNSIITFWVVFVVDFLFAFFLYTFGLVAVLKKSYGQIKFYSKASIAGTLQLMFFSLQKAQFSIPIILFRVAAFLYSQFLAHLVLNLLLLPH